MQFRQALLLAAQASHPHLHASLQAGRKPFLCKLGGCIRILSRCQCLHTLDASPHPAMHMASCSHGWKALGGNACHPRKSDSSAQIALPVSHEVHTPSASSCSHCVSHEPCQGPTSSPHPQPQRDQAMPPCGLPSARRLTRLLWPQHGSAPMTGAPVPAADSAAVLLHSVLHLPNATPVCSHQQVSTGTVTV